MVNGQIWVTGIAAGTVTFNWYYGGTTTSWTWTGIVYNDAASGGTTPWNVGQAGKIVQVVYYDAAYPYSVLGMQMGVSDSNGLVRASTNVGTSHTLARSGLDIGELAILSISGTYLPVIWDGSVWWNLRA